MFTASMNEKDINFSFEKGASLYVKKPITFAREIDILKEIFMRYSNKKLLRHPKHHFVLPLNLKLS
jgi:CheY-like chemotaxis protein